MRKSISIAIRAALLSITATLSVLAENIPVSPGSASDIVPAASSCPTFSWSTDSSSGIELVVTPVVAAAGTIISVALPAGARSWTPPGNQCLDPGQYLWFFRPLDGPDDAWSESLAFEISSLPTLAEVEKARSVLERFVEMGGVYQAVPSQSVGEVVQPNTHAPSPASATDAANASDNRAPSKQSVDTTKSVIITGSALSGYYPGAGGSNVGVQGKVDAIGGAGVAAENTAGGADLLLAGSVTGQVTENTWKLDSVNDQTFEFSNPSGNMTLKVNGLEVLTLVSPGLVEPPSLFGTFGGTSVVDRTIVGSENLDTEVALYRDLTIPAGTTLVINRPVALIAVSGVCDISGTITTVGQGRPGGPGANFSDKHPGKPGTRSNLEGTAYGMVGGLHRLAVDLAISGAGGGGGGAGSAPQQRGGDGGGSEAEGGEGGYTEDGTLDGRPASVNALKRNLMTAGAPNNLQSKMFSDFFSHFIYYPGAGGGGGAIGTGGGIGGNGGDGGGNVYIECRKASFTGSIKVSGQVGIKGLVNTSGGGGGGGGGVALIRALEVANNTGSIDELGGTGGLGAGGAGQGGKGAAGYVEIVDL